MTVGGTQLFRYVIPSVAEESEMPALDFLQDFLDSRLRGNDSRKAAANRPPCQTIPGMINYSQD